MPFYPISYPQINGHRFAFASIELFMNGLPLPALGIKSINYAQSLEPGDVYGSRPQKIGRTRGKQDASCDFEMYRLEWENLKTTLGAAGIGYGEQPFDITVVWSELPFSPVITDAIIGVRITKAEFSNTEGTDASTVKLTGNVMRLIENGTGMIAAPIGVGI